ncbi:Cytochrome P450 [Mycena sanguinolenta]|uniref:Cytochrome P450 n=1 Tax=Mycena sanguinolenta TaxID=230812 RepID=A0A8H6Y0A0_9AGAR|nr:Cytochrome P450 [Mycena sanguinolenta]
MTPIAITCTLLLAFCIGLLLRRVWSGLDNVPGPPPKSFLTGNLSQFHDADGWEFQRELEQSYGQVVKLHGLLGDRQLFVFDQAALHSILVENEAAYEDIPQIMRGFFSATGNAHRKYRKILTPAFSTPHLKEMIPLFYEVAERMRDGLIGPHVVHGPQMVEFTSTLSRTSLELIGRTGIGYSFDPMLPGQAQTDRYAQALKRTVFRMALLIPFMHFVVKMIPFPSFLRSMIHFVPIPALHEARDIIDLMDAAAAQLVKDRKNVLEGEDPDTDAKDVMSLLMKSNINAGTEMHLTDEELVASTSMIVFAATDTTSAALNRTLYILATHPDVQDKLRAEILAAPEHLDHAMLNALPYLDAVLHEVLRLYPPVAPVLYREAIRDTTLPLSTPIIGVDGTPMHTITVPKGTSILIATAAANRCQQVWGEDALKFRPERWESGKADTIVGGTKMCGIYGGTMTFLGGARGCIGFRFAQLELKVVLCVLLRAFKLSNPDPRVEWRKPDVIPCPTIDNQPQLPIFVERLCP